LEKAMLAKGGGSTRQAKEKPMPSKSASIQTQLHFPFWPDPVRAVPNSILRSALFGISKIRATGRNRTLIASNADLEIRFSGDEFNQTDLDVFQGLLHIAMREPLGASVEFGLSSFLSALGRNVGSSQKNELRKELVRLMGGVVEIKWMKEQKTFMGSLIQKIFIDEITGKHKVVFDRDLIMLFDRGHSYVDHQQRLQLGQHSLAKWLHGFYSSHANPYPYKIETVHVLCGSTATAKEFKRLLVRALDKLAVVGAIECWQIEPFSNLVRVRKKTNLKAKSYPQNSSI
jgi:hypothetical protein